MKNYGTPEQKKWRKDWGFDNKPPGHRLVRAALLQIQ